MEKYDTSQLTEFPRFESESSQSGVSTFFNKIWKFPIFSPSESNDNLQNKSLTDGKGPNQQTEDQNKQDYDDKPETGSYAVEFEGRSLPNVLRRISSLVALGSGGGTRYADTELARYWMPDDISRECYECAARFSTLRRRHHCRVCGQIFCSRCCSQRVPGQIFGCAGGLRVCNYCCNVVLSYLRENDMCGEISPDLRTLQENLQVKFPENKSSLQSKKRDNFIFAREQEERCETRTSPKEALQDVFRQLSFTLPTQQHRYRLVRYNGVWRGCDILQWIMDNTNNKTRAQASQVCQHLVLAGYIECCTELPQFADYALYKPMVLPPVPTQGETPEELTRLTESVSSYCLDLNLGEHSARLTRTAKTDNKTSPSSDEENHILEQTEGSQGSRKVCKAIEESGEDHLKLMMRQCLAREGLSSSWLDVLFPLCQQAVSSVLPDLFSNDIDVRHYVQVKKVPGGGAIKESCVVPGVMMTKNVVHRGMPQYIPNPSILLLDCSIAYQRVEGKLTSLEPVLMQEQEYLVRCAARISALRPKVVLVKGTAARVVQDVLRKEGVAMCVGVGARALSRVALTTGASLVTSVDARIAAPRLGAATSFRVTNYTSKTLVTLENCAEPHLGCCLLLRGASLSELVRVKKVARFMLLACYNWKLEKSFLNDIEAVLPEPGMTFDDDDEASEKLTKSDDPDRKPDETQEIEKVSKLEVNHQQENNKTSKDLKTESSIEKEDASDENNDKSRSETEQDPLKARFTRKTDSDKNLSCGVPIRDFSDPLRATLSVDDEVFLPKEETLKADTHNDRWSTDDAVLSMSPNVVMSGAYLASVGGRTHPLRRYFPDPLFRRAVPPPATPRARRARPDTCDVQRKELHPFVHHAITSSVEDPTLRASLAHYRATGATHQPSEHKGGCPLYNPSILMKEQKEETEERQKEKEQTDPLDPLAPENHQRLSLLFYSYSDKSANVPDFCVNPWIMTIEMYGRKDITLGAFLEKYCFNTENKCPSSNCSVPMNQHVRRFVHNDVCITITCNTIGHSNVDKSTEEVSKQVMFWSRCGTCGVSSGAVRRLSRTSLALSLGTYCGLRARTARYTRGGCSHPLHQHAHAFQARLTTACFKYSKISTWEIELPAEVISINYDTKCMRDALINQLNELMLKGHETFSMIADSEAEKDHLNFKQHMEHIHLALTSANLQEQTSLAGVVRSLWNIADRIIAGEKMLRDAQDKWSSPAKPGKVQDIAEEKSSDLEDSGAGESSNENSEIISRDETERGGTEEDEEKGDKKTVRQILSQLLSNNQPANQSGMIISHGLLPVVVFAGEIGSVIAATLASATYQRGLTSLYSTQTEQEETETTNTGKEKADGDKSKAAKSNDHIEVLLKDGLLCRVYYAPQFHRLRHLLLAPLSSNPHITDEFARTLPSETEAKELRCCVEDGKDKCDNKNLCEIEEGFIRSLAQCVPWAACGGKSGSTFCKTKDDRYVLKEMTKPEWQQFLEFAPHYFNYIINCHNNQLPTLLARILGVYSVGGAGNGVLVMENLLYACSSSSQTFDLKGSSRSRLTPESTSPRVLMDDNLLKLRWDTQFYLQSHTARVLRAAVERDTGFLAANCVMDYSLLLGVDENRLVVGIIDYIRTFTWDKKLEHYVKKNLRSGTPTVVSPDQYRARFTHAMNKYFLHCPDHWDHFVTLK